MNHKKINNKFIWSIHYEGLNTAEKKFKRGAQFHLQSSGSVNCSFMVALVGDDENSF